MEEMVNACLHEREFDHVTLPGAQGVVISIMLLQGNFVGIPRVKFVLQCGHNLGVFLSGFVGHVGLDKCEVGFSLVDESVDLRLAVAHRSGVVGGDWSGVRGGIKGRVQRWRLGSCVRCGRGFRGELRGYRARQGFGARLGFLLCDTLCSRVASPRIHPVRSVAVLAVVGVVLSGLIVSVCVVGIVRVSEQFGAVLEGVQGFLAVDILLEPGGVRLVAHAPAVICMLFLVFFGHMGLLASAGSHSSFRRGREVVRAPVVAAHGLFFVVGTVHVVVGDLHDFSLGLEVEHKFASGGFAYGTCRVCIAVLLLALHDTIFTANCRCSVGSTLAQVAEVRTEPGTMPANWHLNIAVHAVLVQVELVVGGSSGRLFGRHITEANLTARVRLVVSFARMVEPGLCMLVECSCSAGMSSGLSGWDGRQGCLVEAVMHEVLVVLALNCALLVFDLCWLWILCACIFVYDCSGTADRTVAKRLTMFVELWYACRGPGAETSDCAFDNARGYSRIVFLQRGNLVAILGIYEFRADSATILRGHGDLAVSRPRAIDSVGLARLGARRPAGPLAHVALDRARASVAIFALGPFVVGPRGVRSGQNGAATLAIVAFGRFNCASANRSSVGC